MTEFATLGRPPRIGPPYPPWPNWLVATIETAIREAGRRVVMRRSSAVIRGATENDLSNWLQDELWKLLDEAEAGFSDAVFDKPMRGAEVENFDGTRISKKPDLSFYRRGNPSGVVDGRHDGWFCECKILDADHDRNDYIHLGMMRFVDGTYAWAMPAAQMIAFVRHPEQEDWVPQEKLLAYLSAVKPSLGKTHADIVSLTGNTVAVDRILTTQHRRDFILRNGKLPGTIALRHLWVQTV